MKLIFTPYYILLLILNKSFIMESSCTVCHGATNCTLYVFARTLFVQVLFCNLFGMFAALLLLTTDFYFLVALANKISFLQQTSSTYNLIFIFKIPEVVTCN